MPRRKVKITIEARNAKDVAALLHGLTHAAPQGKAAVEPAAETPSAEEVLETQINQAVGKHLDTLNAQADAEAEKKLSALAQAVESKQRKPDAPATPPLPGPEHDKLKSFLWKLTDKGWWTTFGVIVKEVVKSVLRGGG